MARTVETDALAVGLVVVNGFPLVGEVRLVAVGFRTIVMVALEDMVKTKRHHVVNACLAALFHHCCHRLHKVFLAREGLAKPLAGYFLRRQLRIPSQTTEGIPVGL